MYTGLFVGFFTFFACVIAFSIGFRFGKAIRDGKEPKLEVISKINNIINPEENENENEESWDAGFRNLMSYDGDPNTK